MTLFLRRQQLSVESRLSVGSYGIVYKQDKVSALKATVYDVVENAPLQNEFDEYIEDTESPGTAEYQLDRCELIEAMILRKAMKGNCDYIVKLNQIYFDSFILGQQHTMVLQLELANFSLVDFMKSQHSMLSEKFFLQILRSIANAILFLHTTMFIEHCDIKPDNVLVTLNGENIFVRLADFGMSTSPVFAVHGNAAPAYTFAYRAPECFDDLHDPQLLQATPELCAAMQNFSCVDQPVVQVVATPAPSTPSTSQSSSSALVCEESLFASASDLAQENLYSEEITNSYSTLVMADEKNFRRVTRCLFASDIWAFGSVALYLFTMGHHPVQRHVDSLSQFEVVSRATLQVDRRLQLYAWHKLVAHHQKNTRNIFQFGVILKHFENTVLRHSSRAAPQFVTIENVWEEHKVSNLSVIDLVQHCLQFDPRQRPTALQLCKHCSIDTVVKSDVDEDDSDTEKGKKRLRSSSRIASKSCKVGTVGFSNAIEYAVARMSQCRKVSELLHYSTSVQFIWDVCEKFSFSYKTALLSIVYLQQTAAVIAKLPYDNWSAPHRFAHVAVCVFMATTLYESRHATVFNVDSLVNEFGHMHQFTSRDLNDLQRLFCELIDFQFDMPTCALFIDEALLQTNTFADMNVALLLEDLKTLSLDSFRVLGVAESLTTALALLKRHKCAKAFDYLLNITGHQMAQVEETLQVFQKLL